MENARKIWSDIVAIHPFRVSVTNFSDSDTETLHYVSDRFSRIQHKLLMSIVFHFRLQCGWNMFFWKKYSAIRNISERLTKGKFFSGFSSFH